MPDNRFTSFKEFWPYYLREHSAPVCRHLHYIGTALSIAALLAAVFISFWWIIAAPLLGYSFAWYAHFKYEKNKPATFQYPFWSLASDYRMFFLWLTGRLGLTDGLDHHLAAAGVKTAPQA